MFQEKRKYIGQVCYVRLSSKTELVSADDSIRIPLSVTEYKILSFFIDHANAPVYLEDLASHVWGTNYDADHKDPMSLKSHITHIRSKLEKIREGLKNILDTNYGLGSYTLKVDAPLFEDQEIPLITMEDSARLPHIITKKSPFYTDERDVICRENTIHELVDLLSGEKDCLLLSGFGGIGKTSVARVIYSKLVKQYDCVGWIEYNEDIQSSILSSFDIFENVKNQDHRWTLICRLIKNSDRRILLFIDNVDRNPDRQQDPLNDRFLYEMSGYPNLSLVLTSRLESLRGYHTYPIEELTEDECEDLFFFYYQKAEYNKPRDQRSHRQTVRQLTARAGFHTFAIELLAKSARRFSSLESFAEMIARVGFQFPSRRISTNYHELELDAASQLRIVFNMKNRPPLEQQILWDISILPNMVLSYEEIDDWLGFQYEDYEELITGGWLSPKDGGIYMHPLVKEVVHFDLINGKAVRGTADRLIHLMNTGSFFSEDDPYHTLLRKFEVVNSVFSFIEPDELKIQALRNMAETAQKIGKITAAISYFRKVLEYTLSQQNDPADLAEAYNDLGYQLSYTSSGRVEAEMLLRKALEIRQDLYAQDSDRYAPSFATTCDYLGYLLSDDEQTFPEGEKLLRTALDIRKKLAGIYGDPYVHDAAWTQDNLGFLLSMMDEKQDEAEQHLREALTVRRQLEEENPGQYLTEVEWTCSNLAFLLQVRGNKEKEAEALYEEAYQALEKADKEMPGVHIVDVAINNNNRAVLIASDPSRKDECRSYFLRALQIFNARNHESPGLYTNEIAAVTSNLQQISDPDEQIMNILSGSRIVQIRKDLSLSLRR